MNTISTMGVMGTIKTSTEELSTKLVSPKPVSQPQNNENTKSAVLSPDKLFEKHLKSMESEIAKALPSHMTIDRLSRLTLTLVRTNPQLLKVFQEAPATLWSAILLSAQLGLDPTPSLGKCYIIPFKNNRTGKLEAQFQIGYKGLLELLYRSGEVESIQTDIVYEKDYYELDLGFDHKFIHRPFLDGERGAAKFFYCIVKFKTGGQAFEYMTPAQVQRIMGRSQSAGGSFSPWKTDYEEMAKKTVIKRACKKLPLSIDVMRNIIQDETVKSNIAKDMLDEQEGEKVDFIDILNSES